MSGEPAFGQNKILLRQLMTARQHFERRICAGFPEIGGKQTSLIARH